METLLLLAPAREVLKERYQEAIRNATAGTIGEIASAARRDVEEKLRSGELFAQKHEKGEKAAPIVATEEYEKEIVAYDQRFRRAVQGAENIHAEKLDPTIKGQAESGGGEGSIRANQEDLSGLVVEENGAAQDAFDLMIAHERKHTREVMLRGNVEIDDRDTLTPFDASEGRAETGSHREVGEAATTRREGIPGNYAGAQSTYLELETLVGKEEVEEEMTTGDGSPEELQIMVWQARVRDGSLSILEALKKAQEQGMGEEEMRRIAESN